jgi:hypothetical protein
VQKGWDNARDAMSRNAAPTGGRGSHVSNGTDAHFRMYTSRVLQCGQAHEVLWASSEAYLQKFPYEITVLNTGVGPVAAPEAAVAAAVVADGEPDLELEVEAAVVPHVEADAGSEVEPEVGTEVEPEVEAGAVAEVSGGRRMSGRKRYRVSDNQLSLVSISSHCQTLGRPTVSCLSD